MHAGGLDLHRIHPDSARPGPVVASPRRWPPPCRAAPRRRTPSRAAPVPLARPTGWGRGGPACCRWARRTRTAARRASCVYNADPWGGWRWRRRGCGATAGLERGASLAAVWRGMRPAVAAEAFYLDHDPSRLAAYDAAGHDARYAGAALNGAEHLERGAAGAGVAAGRLRRAAGPGECGAAGRIFGFGRYYATDGRRTGPGYAAGVLSVTGAAGQTLGERMGARDGDDGVRRGVGRAGPARGGVDGPRERRRAAVGAVDGGRPRARRWWTRPCWASAWRCPRCAGARWRARTC